MHLIKEHLEVALEVLDLIRHLSICKLLFLESLSLLSCLMLIIVEVSVVLVSFLHLLYVPSALLLEFTDKLGYL